MKTEDKIVEAAYNYERLTGKRANLVYLGEIQWVALVAAALKSGVVIKKNTIEESRVEFRGLSVFLVDADDHLNVSHR